MYVLYGNAELPTLTKTQVTTQICGGKCKCAHSYAYTNTNSHTLTHMHTQTHRTHTATQTHTANTQHTHTHVHTYRRSVLPSNLLPLTPVTLPTPAAPTQQQSRAGVLRQGHLMASLSFTMKGKSESNECGRRIDV